MGLPVRMNGHVNGDTVDDIGGRANGQANRVHTNGHSDAAYSKGAHSKGVLRGAPGLSESGESGESWEQQFLPPPLLIDDTVRAQKVEQRLAGMVLCGAMLRRLAEAFELELERGLRDQASSSLQMENTYVPELPDGTEEGVFLALDLGGTNFRVLLLELKQGQVVRQEVKHYHISDELRVGPGADLFNFLADCVQDFLRCEGMEQDELSLGFTFSFPMKHHSISSGELITWTKSFKCGGMRGADLAGLLQRCLRARGLRVTVRVLLNDTTGTLMAGAMLHPQVGIGVILGTGSNGCYMERAARVQRWEAPADGARDVCVDVEWGAFGDNGCIDFIRTDIDTQVDQHSLLVRSFTFEKCIGGKYLGCVLSVALAALAREGLFPAAPPHDGLLAADLSLFEEEKLCGETTRTLEVLRRVVGAGGRPAGGGGRPAGGVQLTVADALVAQYVAQVISNRAAQLVSVCIATILQRMDRPFVAVAVDGSVYKRHPRIAALINKYTALLAPDHPFCMLRSEDGSGKGSALTAAIAARIAARHDAAAPGAEH